VARGAQQRPHRLRDPALSADDAPPVVGGCLEPERRASIGLVNLHGLHVAQLAGVPRHVVDEARDYLGTLERQLQSLTESGPQEQFLFSAPQTTDPLRTRLAELDVDDLSPRQALEMLFELSDEARRD